MRPHFASVVSTRCCNSSLRPILQGTAIASPPAASIWATAVLQASALRPEITTFAPCSARPLALARPRPRLEPVTMATLPWRSNKEEVIGQNLNDVQNIIGQETSQRYPAARLPPAGLVTGLTWAVGSRAGRPRAGARHPG